jgi:hypothetical protein
MDALEGLARALPPDTVIVVPVASAELDPETGRPSQRLVRAVRTHEGLTTAELDPVLYVRARALAELPAPPAPRAPSSPLSGRWRAQRGARCRWSADEMMAWALLHRFARWPARSHADELVPRSASPVARLVCG